jgi:hypothetical protein
VTGAANKAVPADHLDSEPSVPMQAEIAALEADGYVIYRAWANGIELRKKLKVGSVGTFGRCVLVLLAPVIFVPLFGRAILAVVSGYEYRVFLTRDAIEPKILLV